MAAHRAVPPLLPSPRPLVARCAGARSLDGVLSHFLVDRAALVLDALHPRPSLSSASSSSSSSKPLVTALVSCNNPVPLSHQPPPQFSERTSFSHASARACRILLSSRSRPPAHALVLVLLRTQHPLRYPSASSSASHSSSSAPPPPPAPLFQHTAACARAHTPAVRREGYCCPK